MRELTTLWTMITALLSVGAAPANASNTHEPPPYVTIGNITANGSGCPDGTVAVNWSPDRTAFTVTYSNFLAQRGPGISVLESRRNCQVNFQVIIPQGYTYAIQRTDYRGFAELAPGATAMEQANYYFGGMRENDFRTHYLTGPWSNNWIFSDANSIGALVYHPCGIRPIFNINQILRVLNSKQRTSYINMDSTDTSFSTLYHVQWRRCTQ